MWKTSNSIFHFCSNQMIFCFLSFIKLKSLNATILPFVYISFKSHYLSFGFFQTDFLLFSVFFLSCFFVFPLFFVMWMLCCLNFIYRERFFPCYSLIFCYFIFQIHEIKWKLKNYMPFVSWTWKSNWKIFNFFSKKTYKKFVGVKLQCDWR